MGNRVAIQKNEKSLRENVKDRVEMVHSAGGLVNEVSWRFIIIKTTIECRG
jgi:hypothetical protein